MNKDLKVAFIFLYALVVISYIMIFLLAHDISRINKIVEQLPSNDINISNHEMKLKQLVKYRETIISHKTVIEDAPVETKITNDSEYLLAQIIYAEAKGEPYEGMVAVANVVLNRVESNNFPGTIKNVVYQKGQFQPVSNGSINNHPSDEAIRAAKEAMKYRNMSKDILYFYNPKIATSQWIFTRPVVSTVGNHAFAK